MGLRQRSAVSEEVVPYWDAFYATGRMPPLPSSMFSPSPFARELIANVFNPYAKPLRIIELGCGNGRDANYFAANGHAVVAIDRSRVAIDQAKLYAPVAVRYVRMDVGDLDAMDPFPPPVDVVYARWLFHAVSPMTQTRILQWAKATLGDGGVIAIEARTTEDARYGKGIPVGDGPGRTAFIDSQAHYRRFIRIADLADELYAIGYAKPDVWEWGTNLAPQLSDADAQFDSEPHLIRCVASLNKTNASPLVKSDSRKPIIIRKGTPR